MNLTEALVKSRLKKNFEQFFNEMGKDIIEDIITIIVYIFELIVEDMLKKYKKDELFKKFSQFGTSSDIRKVVNEEMPTIYMEKILSTLKKNYTVMLNRDPKDIVEILSSIENSPLYTIDFKKLWSNEDKLYVANLLKNYTGLLFLRIFLNLNGFSNEKLFELESKVYNNNVDDILEEIYKILNELIEEKNRKELSKMRNRKVFENENIEVYKVDDSREACITLGKGTDWCVANTHTDVHYKEYSSYGDMFVFIFKKIKNTYDGIGPEKVLLTVKNKQQSSRIWMFHPFLFEEAYEKIKNGEYSVETRIEDINDKDVTDEIFKFIKDERNFEIFKKFIKRDKILDDKQSALIENYLLDEFAKYFNFEEPEVKNFFKKIINYSLEIMFKAQRDLNNGIDTKDPTFREFVEPLYRMFYDIYKKYINSAFNLNKIKSKFNEDDFEILKELKDIINITLLYDWIENIRDLKLVNKFIIKDGDKTCVIPDYIFKSTSFNVNFLLKYELIIADSNNNHFPLSTTNDRYKRLVKHMMEWPYIEKNLMFGSMEELEYIKKTIESKLLNYDQNVKTVYNQVIESIPKNNDMLIQLKLLKKNISFFVKKFYYGSSFYEFIKETYNPIVFAFANKLSPHREREMNDYNQIIVFFEIEDSIKRLSNIYESLFKDMIDYMKMKGFFESKSPLDTFEDNILKYLQDEIDYYTDLISLNSENVINPEVMFRQFLNYMENFFYEEYYK